MGKVREKVKLTSLFDATKTREVEAVIDTGATMLVLPQNVVDELGLRKIRDAKVKYANNKVEQKWVYGAVTIELKGRVGIFEALAEEAGSQPLVGQIVLEALDLVVDPRTRTLIPNPISPEMPMVEILMATAYNSGHTATLRSSQIVPFGNDFVCPQPLYAIGFRTQE
jgi:clan AA aspartic protease